DLPQHERRDGGRRPCGGALPRACGSRGPEEGPQPPPDRRADHSRAQRRHRSRRCHRQREHLREGVMSDQTPETAVARPGDRASAFSLDVEERSTGEAIRGWVIKLRTGDPGALPSVVGLIILAIIFNQVSSRFLTKYNIGNIPGQVAYIAVIGLGLVFVLLLGEIDLSAGTAGGT